MTINGWNIEEAGARQFNVAWGYHAVVPRSEWIQSADMPVLADPTIGFKPLQIVLVVKEPGREAIRESASRILAHLLEPVEIVLDGTDHIFYGYLKKHTAAEMVRKRWHTLTLELEGYEYGEPVAASGESLELWNEGTIPSPAVLRITPPAGLSQITVTGLDEDITLTGISSGEEILIDGENGIATQGGTILETDFLRFPRVLPGVLHLASDSTGATLNLSFKPRYL